MRRFLLLFSFVGVITFGSAFILSFVSPLRIEKAGREILRIEIQREVGEQIDTLSRSKIVALTQRAIGRTDQEIEATQRGLRNLASEKVNEVISNMQDANCECRKRLVAYLRALEAFHLHSLMELREKLVTFVESTYASVAAKLMREFRIFTGTNFAAFAILGVITYVRGNEARHVAVPGIVIVGAVIVTSSLYLFRQNWLHTILFNDYLGFGYAGYLTTVAGLLGDIALNEGRVTAFLTEVAGALYIGAIKALSC